MQINFLDIVARAWARYDDSRAVQSVADISVLVSTNHVFRVRLENGDLVIAKVSYFGRYEAFVEDHTLINALANNLPAPFDQFLSRSLVKKNRLFVYRHQDELLDVWVIFYNPIGVNAQLPKQLQPTHIEALGRQLALFHRACSSLTNILPDWSKTLRRDMRDLAMWLEQPEGQFYHRSNIGVIQEQMALFEENTEALGAHAWKPIPVFVDWNIGNFSVTKDLRFFSRWDYDWFRMSSRVFDFYFFSRVCSQAGDRSVFSYQLDTLSEPGFLRFLSAYHEVYPLTRAELAFLPEAYRFFILNYVIKYGHYFFQDIYASKLGREAFTQYFPRLQQGFDAEQLCRRLGV